MVELVVLAMQVGFDIAQTLTAGELRHQHANKLIPATHRTQFLACVVLFSEPLEFIPKALREAGSVSIRASVTDVRRRYDVTKPEPPCFK